MTTQTADITPEGVRKDPARVAAAAGAFEAATTALRRSLEELFGDYRWVLDGHALGADDHDLRDALAAADAALAARDAAQEEFLRAVAGR